MIQAEISEIRATGKKVVDTASQYLTVVDQIYDTINELQSIWQGPDNLSYANQVNGYKKNIVALGEVISNYGVFLQETANTLEKLQSDNAAEAARM